MKTYLAFGTLATVIIGILFIFNGGENKIALPVATTTPSVQTESVIIVESVLPTQPAAQATLQTTKTIPVATTTPTPTPNITLSVAGKLYTIFAPKESTVLDAMRALASTSDFKFTGHDYTSLGFFVDSINGKKTEKSYNWMLYLNGKLSNTGASQTTLSAGDTVEWKYEKNY